MLDEQSGDLPAGVTGVRGPTGMFDFGTHEHWGGYGDTGGASRFFPVFVSDPADRMDPRCTSLNRATEPECPPDQPGLDGSSSSMSRSGSEQTGLFQQDIKSTTSTATRPITDSTTSPVSPPENTAGSTTERFSGTGSGGSSAADAGARSPSSPGSTDAVPVASRTDAGTVRRNSSARFLYEPKADRSERHVGGIRNTHPTVKSVALMQWLVRLVTPPKGLILDPFTGSGTTGMAALREGFGFLGIEREPEYVQIARARIEGDAPLFNTREEAR